MNTPAEQWKDLKTQTLVAIDAIDKATPWQETEPKWWLEMMEVRRKISAE